MIELFRNKGNRIGQKRWPRTLAYEVACLANDRSVKGSLRVNELHQGGVAILFTLLTDPIAEPAKADIRDEEPIALVYTHGRVGLEAPAVYSDRSDFPRVLPHLNPVARNSPASICLAREGLQPLYERGGIPAVLARLRRWMRDAKTGSLSREGWEPVPVNQATVSGLIEGAEFQEFAARQVSASRRAWGVAMTASSGAALYLRAGDLTAEELPFDRALDRLPNGKNVDPAEDEKNHRWIPVVFSWQPTTSPGTDFVFGDYRDVAHLWDDVQTLGLDASVREALQDLCASRRWPAGSGPVQAVVLLGVRRPLPIIGDRFGLSLDGEARSLELRGFLLSGARVEDLSRESASVAEISLWPWPNQRLLADVSGAPVAGSPCLIGYGALGSEIGAFLTRMGVRGITAIDPDRLAGHNIARHVGAVFQIGEAKPSIHTTLEQLVALDEPSYRGLHKSIEDLSAEAFSDCAGRAAIMVDATASDRVRRTLPPRARAVGRRIVRTELFDEGYLGVQTLEGETGNPDLLDLYYWLCQRGVEDELVKGWLARERSGSINRQAIVAGFGCASASVRLPKWMVSSHATAFMPTIIGLLRNGTIDAGIGLNPLSREGYPLGWRWLPVPMFAITQHRLHGEAWEVRVARGVSERMAELARQALPNETGGYLYGGWELHLHRGTVTAATPQPPGTTAGPVSLRLGPAGHTDAERQIQSDCADRIEVVGTWHSHPGGSVAMSPRDQMTAQEFARDNRALGLPVLIMISGATGVGVYLTT